MLTSARRFALAALLLACSLLIAPFAAAQEGVPQTSADLEAQKEQAAWVESADEVFGRFIVDYLDMVLFWDVIFWDNTLPRGEGVGAVIDGEEVTAWTEAGYIYQRLSQASPTQVSPDLAAPVVRDFDGIRVQVVQRQGALLGIVPEQAVALPRYGVSPLPEGDPGSQDNVDPVVTGDSKAPFAVRIDRARGVILPAEFAVPDGALPIAAGMRVRMGDDMFDVLEASTDTLRLRSTATRADPSKLPNPENREFPIVVLWLIVGALFFTVRMQLVNVWAFGHAIKVTAGAYDDPDDPGEIPHFKALTSALSATVGLGNIAGVAIAIGMGGPGAIFWMICAGFLGMSSKFTECTLGQMYRVERPDGSISGGPMHYLDVGLKELGIGRFGKLLAVVFALMCIGGSFGGGNMFQANQSYAAIQDVVPLLEGRAWLYGLIMAFLVALVIIGGIRRIGTATSLIVPIMCGIYVLAGLWILVVNAEEVPQAGASSAPWSRAFGALPSPMRQAWALPPSRTRLRPPSTASGKASWRCWNPSSTPSWCAP